MNDAAKRNFIAQGSILAVTGIICRIIGMFYRIPLIAVIGTEGNGYYTSAYSIYNILLILSSYSLPTALSKVISVRLARKRYEDVRTVLRVAFFYSTLMGGACCMMLWFGAPKVASFMQKPFCEYALRCLAPTIWIMAYLGILRGFFQGSGNMIPTAISQFLEQVVNAAVSILMAVILFNYGLKANLLYGETEFSYAFGAAGGTLGTGAGALIALLFFILLFLLYGKMPHTNGIHLNKKRGLRESRVPRGRALIKETKKESTGAVAAALLITLIPILLSSTVYNISTVADDLIFSRVMASLGLAADVVFLWGVFGEYRILFNIPVAMANSLSSSLIPSLTNAYEDRDMPSVRQKIRLSIQFVMLISMPAAVGLFALSRPICDLLFRTGDNALLVTVLRLGTPAIVLYSLSTVSNALLQGLGYLREPLINSLISLIVHVLLLTALIYVLRDINSVIIASTVFALMVSVLNSLRLHSHVRFRVNVSRTFVKPFIASVAMGAAAALLSRGIELFLGGGMIGSFTVTLIEVIVCIALACPVYLVMLCLLRSFSKEELLQMPFGTRLYSLLSSLSLI